MPNFDDVAEEAPNQLTLVNLVLGDEHTLATFCNPAHTREVLRRLANKEYIKLRGDGTYRLTQGRWTLCTVGVITKHYRDQDGGMSKCFSSTFHPLAYMIANVEAEVTYLSSMVCVGL